MNHKTGETMNHKTEARFLELINKQEYTQFKIASILNKESVPHYKGYSRPWNHKDVSAYAIKLGVRRKNKPENRKVFSKRTAPDFSQVQLVTDIVTSNLGNDTKERLLRSIYAGV